MILSITPENPEKNLIKKAVEVLRNGGIIAYPTDTMYGIGCDIFNREAMKKVFTVKKRGENKAISFICPDVGWIKRYAEVTTDIETITQTFLPGPYTFILKAKKNFPSSRTVGIRVPANTICTSIVYELGSPISSTSANISGKPPLSTPAEILTTMGNYLDLIIDGGCIPPEPSSVIDLTKKKPVVIRKGKGDVRYFNKHIE